MHLQLCYALMCTLNQWLGRSGVDLFLGGVWLEHMVVAIATSLHEAITEHCL